MQPANPHVPMRRSQGASCGGVLLQHHSASMAGVRTESPKTVGGGISPHVPSHSSSWHAARPSRHTAAPGGLMEDEEHSLLPPDDPARGAMHAAAAAAGVAAAMGGVAATAASSSSSSSSSGRSPSNRSLPAPFPHARSAPVNVMQQLLGREVRSASHTPAAFRRQTYAHRFGRLKLQRTLDSRVAGVEVEGAPLPKRSKISEIVSTGDFLFALTALGVCVAFDRSSGFKQLCCLNVIADEVIRSLFYNRVNRSLITVSVYRHDHFTSLRCRSTTLEAILAGKPELGVPLFQSESLQWPGFVEFDDVNKKVLTFSASSSLYKVWSLYDYRLLYQLCDKTIDEVKISPGIMLLIHARDKQRQSLRIINIDNGETLQQFTHVLPKNQKVVFIEQFNEKLLVKQKRAPMQLVDVAARHACVELSESEFPTPGAFIFLYENSLFLTFSKREIGVWNFSGQRVASFDDHFNFFADCNTSNVFISHEQDLIVSYCLTHTQIAALKNRQADPDAWLKAKERSGCINVSHIFSGKCIAKIERMHAKKFPIQLLSPVQQHHALMAKLTRQASDVQRQQRADQCAHLTAATDAHAKMSPNTARRTADLHAQARTLERQLALTRESIRALETRTAAVTAAAAGPTADVQTAANLATPAAAAPSDSVDTLASLDSAMEVDDDDDDDDAADALDDEDEDEDGAADRATDSDATDSDEEDEADVDAREPELAMADIVPLRAISFRAAAAASTTTGVSSSSSTASSASAIPGAHSPPPPLSHPMGCEWPLRSLDDYRAFNRHVHAHNQALRDISAVFYSEEKNEIYTGNKAGFINVWAQ